MYVNIIKLRDYLKDDDAFKINTIKVARYHFALG